MFVNNNHPTERCVLVMDVGNTSIKWALFLKNDIIWRGRDHEIDDHAFEVHAVYFASVRDDSNNLLLLEEVGKRYPNANVLDLKVSAVACGVENAYSEPHRLGIDRWLGVLYVHSQYQGTVVVVDAGTAVKIDVVNSDGRHLGGYIAPSSDMMEKIVGLEYRADPIFRSGYDKYV
ncbi:type III pantothenate kinase [Marinomonas sp. 15G1-11]|uniref:Type III pantothenate kinase n=1 Tax=Marinomonas phaeophyticola TaxID=3004091 RepID=A0ABT4JVX0_9GAMM|nr:type III pantothenate kinase [Marinomonas sp. 15G1-11]MCZ2722529.1 type III pantothenate kinase [Marinomonas sp. 15G1-11]